MDDVSIDDTWGDINACIQLDLMAGESDYNAAVDAGLLDMEKLLQKDGGLSGGDAVGSPLAQEVMMEKGGSPQPSLDKTLSELVKSIIEPEEDVPAMSGGDAVGPPLKEQVSLKEGPSDEPPRGKRVSKRRAAQTIDEPASNRGKKRPAKKLKLYEHVEPFKDPKKEKERQNAINAKNNRERKKQQQAALTDQINLLRTRVEELKEEVAQERELRQAAEAQVRELTKGN